MPIKLWYNLAGSWTDPQTWSSHTVPAAGDFDIIEGGTVTLSGVDTSWQTIWVNSLSETSPAALYLENNSLNTGSYLSLSGTNNNALVTLQNTAMNGSVFAGEGPSILSVAAASSAVNYGWYGVASQTTSSSMLDATLGAFANVGVIEVGVNGSFTLLFGRETGNFGVIQADLGGQMSLSSNAGVATADGTVDNHGLLNVNGGSVSVNANLVQDTGTIDIENNGSLILGGATTGGLINIQSGMLDFAGIKVQAPIPSFAASAFQSTVAFTGLSAVLAFGTTTGLGEMFDASTDRLFVTAPFEGVQQTTGLTLHLVGSYTANDFSVIGSTIVYTAHTAT